jgi:hypothetical protein
MAKKGRTNTTLLTSVSVLLCKVAILASGRAEVSKYRSLSIALWASGVDSRIELVCEVLLAILPVKCSAQPTTKISAGTTELHRISGSVIFLRE